MKLLCLSKNELENGPSGDSTDKGPSDTLQNEVSLCSSAWFQPAVMGALLGRSSPTPEQPRTTEVPTCVHASGIWCAEHNEITQNVDVERAEE